MGRFYRLTLFNQRIVRNITRMIRVLTNITYIGHIDEDS